MTNSSDESWQEGSPPPPPLWSTGFNQTALIGPVFPFVSMACIYSIGLSVELVDDPSNVLAASDHVTVATSPETVSGNAIPESPISIAPGFKLSEARIWETCSCGTELDV